MKSLGGSDWNQQPPGRWKNSWYDLNVRAVLASLAIEGGGSDLSDFLSLIEISQQRQLWFELFSQDQIINWQKPKGMWIASNVRRFK